MREQISIFSFGILIHPSHRRVKLSVQLQPLKKFERCNQRMQGAETYAGSCFRSVLVKLNSRSLFKGDKTFVSTVLLNLPTPGLWKVPD